MQQGDYSSAPYYQYPHIPNPSLVPNSTPTPADLHQTAYASAPPFAANYSPIPSEYPSYPPNYSSYSQNSDHLPVSPTAPSYTPSNPNHQLFNPTPQPSPFPTFESHVTFQSPPPPQQQQQSYYPPFDQHQTAHDYVPSSSSVPNKPISNPTPSSNSLYSSEQYAPFGSSTPPSYGNPHYNSVKLDQARGYVDNKYGNYNQSISGFGSDLYGKMTDNGVSRYESNYDDGFGDGVYAYQGGKVEPYGARGTSPKSSTWTGFDDYGRPINFPSGKGASGGSSKIVRATPKADTQDDVKSSVQKFRVKLLSESGGQNAMDVLCQIGLDGIRMLDPNTGRTLRIYPLETIAKCEVVESSTLAIWSKSSVDIEPRRIRLLSNSYTTNTLLDTVTAATVQFKEMGGRSRPPDSFRSSEQSVERKKGFGDWMNMRRLGNVEKDHWMPDEAVSKCTSCGTDFSAFVRKHHCRNCGDIFCDKCTHGRISLTSEENAPQVRVCDRCMAEVTQRLHNAKEAASKPTGFQSHEDLAKKLQEEMERNRRSSGSRSDEPGKRTKEVACPTCTVHLQVQVPISGSQTIECGVCQNPFLVGAGAH